MDRAALLTCAGALVWSTACGGSGNDLFGGATASGAGGATASTTSTSTTGAGGASATAEASSSANGSGGSCAKTTWYCDADGDMHGDAQVSVEACVAPPGGDATCAGPYLASSDDCGPGDVHAYPGEGDYFDTPAMGPITTGPAFDYDCDGVASPKTEQLFKGTGAVACMPQDCFINPPAGFSSKAECGKTDEYYSCAQGITCAAKLLAAPAPLACK